MQSKILFRCSQLGKLMIEPRSKTETLSETTKKYLAEVYASVKYGRKKDIVNKYIQKGLMVEEDAITLLSRLDKQMFLKNEVHLKNDFIMGTPDIYEGPDIEHAEVITDTKASWDIFTFFAAKTESINKDYYWQGQGYMALTGAKLFKLRYCLVDTPDVLINDAKRKFMWSAGILDENTITEEAFAEIEKNCLFNDIPIPERVHTIEIQYNQDDVNRLYMRIEDCRDYIQKTFNFPMVQIPETV